jgi:hypothetical protein
MIKTNADYEFALLHLLESLPRHEGRTQDVINLFGERYHDQIPRKHFSRDATGHIRWDWRVRWTRQALVERGLMDSPRHGIWHITPDGRRWLVEQASLTNVAAGPDTKPSTVVSEPSDETAPSQSMYAVQSVDREKTVAVRRRGRPPKATSNAGAVPDGRYAILDQEIKVIQDYLAGRKSHIPTSEQLCDWVQFCYRFEMFQEGRDLFALVNPAEVNPWYFERAKKFAAICKMRSDR